MDTAESRVSGHVVDQFYIGYLKDSLNVIERALLNLEAGVEFDPSLFRAEVVAHKIKGNAALYDLPELGEIAKHLEALLKDDRAGDAVLAGMHDFADAMSDIIDLGRLQNAGAIKDSEERGTAVASANLRVSAGCKRLVSKNILLVFENPWFAEPLSGYLSGANVEICRSCGDAIRWLSKHTPDLIVCESDLPDTPGIEFMLFMRGNERFAKVPFLLAFPGKASFDEISEAIAAGASAFVEHTGDVPRLAEQIVDMLSSDSRLILIIDDDEPVRDLLKHTFEVAGYGVDTAGDGIEALLKIRERKPSLIILDRIMPRMDGEATLRELQATMTVGSVPVIMLTAMDNVGEASRWLMRGASEFIAKPFDPEEVLERARKLLKQDKTRFA